MQEQDKIILKRDRLDGVDKSVSDYSMLASVKVLWTVVTAPMFKKGALAFIGVKERLDDGDIIQVGALALKYRVVKQHKFPRIQGNVYRIKRVDGYNITSLDIEATQKGQKVKILNRRNFISPYSVPAEDSCGCEPKNSSPVNIDIIETPAPPQIRYCCNNWSCSACEDGEFASLEECLQACVEPQPNPLPCDECLRAVFTDGEGNTYEAYLNPTGTYVNGTIYYWFTFEGTLFEVYNSTWNIPDSEPGTWLLYEYEDGSGDIAENASKSECPTGVFDITSGPFTSFELTLCGSVVTPFVLYRVYIDGGGASSFFVYPDCGGNSKQLDFGPARGGEFVFVCSAPGNASNFVSSAVDFVVTELAANCNC
jgi:hypothetical protein